MTAQQVVRVCRAIARCAAALADELEQTTTEADRAEVAGDAEGDWDPQDVCEVGDPDPTPDQVEWCGRNSPHDRWMCTRLPGHSGQHVAGHHKRVEAVWPGDATGEPDNAPAPGWEMST